MLVYLQDVSRGNSSGFISYKTRKNSNYRYRERELSMRNILQMYRCDWCAGVLELFEKKIFLLRSGSIWKISEIKALQSSEEMTMYGQSSAALEAHVNSTIF